MMAKIARPKKIVIYISETAEQKLSAAAKLAGMSKSEFARQLMNEGWIWCFSKPVFE